MTKIDIVSGFLGAGKTTLIQKLLSGPFQGEKLVLIENEFGEIGIDGGFLKESGVQITEMNAGCICCSLVGDFGSALRQVVADYAPTRIVIEPSGVGKLSEVIAAVQGVEKELPLQLNSAVAVVDATRAKLYVKNFGEFFNNQVANATSILLSRTQALTPEQVDGVVAILRTLNQAAPILTTPWDDLSGEDILRVIEGKQGLTAELMEEVSHNHDHDHDHASDDACAGCPFHHAHHEGCGHASHTAEADPCAGCGVHHHHTAEEFSSWAKETTRNFDREDLQEILSVLAMTQDCGYILRGKGILPSNGGWLHFDLVPGEFQIREGSADYTGRLCVIGTDLNPDALSQLFML